MHNAYHSSIQNITQKFDLYNHDLCTDLSHTRFFIVTRSRINNKIRGMISANNFVKWSQNGSTSIKYLINEIHIHSTNVNINSNS